MATTPVSNPASSIVQRSMGPMKAALAQVAMVRKMMGQAGSVGQSAGARIAKGLTSARDSARQATKAVSDFVKGAQPRNTQGQFQQRPKWLGGLRGMGDSIAKGIGEALGGGLAGGAADLAQAGVSYAAKMATFRENALFSFKYITGSQQGAVDLLDKADQLARSMGAKTTDVAGSMRELMQGGFDEKTSMALTAGMADLKAMNPTANVEAIAAQVAQMKGSGKVLMEDLKPILNAGLNDDKFYEVLREMTGEKDQAKLKKMMSGGKVTADQGIAAILETMKRQGGGGALGQVAQQKAMGTTGGAIENALGMFERFIVAINSSPAGKLLADMANSLAQALDPAGGGREMLDLINSVVSLVNQARPYLDAMGGAFGTAFGEGIRTVKELLVFTGMLSQGPPDQGLIEALKMIASFAGTAAAGVLVLVGVLGFVYAKLSGGAAFVWGAAISIGQAIIDGMSVGLDAAKAGLIQRLTTLAALLPESVRKLLGIHSPSRVFAEIGGYTVEGLQQGIERGTPGARGAMLGAAEPPRLQPAQGRLAQRLRESGGDPSKSGADRPPVVMHNTFNIEVSGTGDKRELVRELETELDAYMMRVWERLLNGQGVPTT